MVCKHKETRKLFWLNKKSWTKTNFSFCLKCEKVVQMQPTKTMKKNVKERNNP